MLTGAGPKAFIGGANILEMAALTAENCEGFITLVHRCCAALRDLPVPVIARPGHPAELVRMPVDPPLGVRSGLRGTP